MALLLLELCGDDHELREDYQNLLSVSELPKLNSKPAKLLELGRDVFRNSEVAP